MNGLDLLQWSSAMLTVLGAWFVGSKDPRRRRLGLWTYLVSNAVWVAWGLPSAAYALVALQVFLAALNVRGIVKADAQDSG